MARRPNLVFVFADQMRYAACRYREHSDPVFTPNLDRFAGQGVTLTHAVATYPVCSPYRGMLMSGCYPLTSGVPGNCNSAPGREGWRLREDLTCFTDVLHDAGYHVGYLGKWHLEAPHEPYVMPPGHMGLVWNEYTPPHRRHGIDNWHGYNTYDNHFAPEYWMGDAPRDRRTRVDRWSPEHETDVAIDYLRNAGGSFRDADRPFALFVSHNPPHPPYELVPDRYREPYRDATPRELLIRPNVDHASDHPNAQTARDAVRDYFAAVTGVDEQFGRLLAELDTLGLADDTLVVFTADHGEMMGSHDRMQKSVWYDESLRVPFIARFPGRLAAGAADDLLLGAPDVAPTLLGLLGLGASLPGTMQGRDYAATLRGQRDDRPASAFYFAGESRARGVRTPRYTLARQLGKPAQAQEAGRGPTLGPVTELFDNHDDPYQLRNLADDRPELVADLRAELDAWLARTDDPWTWDG